MNKMIVSAVEQSNGNFDILSVHFVGDNKYEYTVEWNEIVANVEYNIVFLHHLYLTTAQQYEDCIKSIKEQTCFWWLFHRYRVKYSIYKQQFKYNLHKAETILRNVKSHVFDSYLDFTAKYAVKEPVKTSYSSDLGFGITTLEIELK